MVRLTLCVCACGRLRAHDCVWVGAGMCAFMWSPMISDICLLFLLTLSLEIDSFLVEALRPRLLSRLFSELQRSFLKHQG